MSSKVDRAVHGPGWAEVIIGAILSLILGIALGAVLMVTKPVQVAKEMPKDPVPGVVYYIEGQRGDANRARYVLEKSNAVLHGQTVKLTESEINSLILASKGPVAPAAARKKDAEAEAAEPAVATGTPNVRIREGTMQIGVPVTLTVLGIQHKVIVQTRGGFQKRGDAFVYEPAEILIGSCPIQRLPIVGDYARRKVVEAQKFPDEIAGAWSKLSRVEVQGNELTLAM